MEGLVGDVQLHIVHRQQLFIPVSYTHLDVYKRQHLLRTQDFTELEAALRAADGHLELNAPEEAFGELRRAQVQVETLEWLSRRLV